MKNIRFYINGYLSQIVGILLLFCYNLVLPGLIGVGRYGIYIYSASISYLFLSFFQEGFSTLIIKNHQCLVKIERYLRVQFLYVFCGFIIWGSVYFHKAEFDIPYWTILFFQTLLQIFYNYQISIQTSSYRNDLLLYSTINNGLALVVIPLAIFYLGLTDWLRYGYFFVILESCLFSSVVNLFNNLRNVFPRIGLGKKMPSFIYMLRLLYHQVKLSLSFALNGIVVWGTFLLLEQIQGLQYAANFKISMSVVMMLVGIMPLHRKSLLVFMKHGGVFKYIKLPLILSFFIWIVGIILVRCFSLHFANLLWPGNGTQIFTILSILIYLAPLKAAIDLVSIYYIQESKTQFQLNVAFVVLCSFGLFIIKFWRNEMDLSYLLLGFYSINILVYLVEILLSRQKTSKLTTNVGGI